MKQYFKNIIIFSISVILFVSCPFSVYASDHGGSGGTDHNPDFITDSGTINVKDDGVVMYYIEYILANVGAVFRDHDLSKAMANDQTMKEYISKGKFDANTNTVTFPKETVTYVYNTFNTIAKENEPYTIYRTIGKYDAEIPTLMSKNMWDTMVYLLNESPSGIIAFGVKGSKYQEFAFTDVGHWFSKMSPVKSDDFSVRFYNNETWNEMIMQVHFVTLLPEDDPVKTWEEVKSKSYNNIQYYDWEHPMCGNFFSLSMDYANKYPQNVHLHNSITYRFAGTSRIPLISTDGRRIRVFNTYGDFQNYTLGKRNVYYTSNYYDYVPEDLSVSIDDLQKTVDDLSKVIDQLLGQISKDTDENEIEDLLQQILDELKNNQGSGGNGGGSGGGDVNVDIDLSTTNTLLSKILAKVTQIFDKISETTGSAADTAGAKIQETLDEILAQIKKIKHWTIADTAVGAADAVADWLDFLKDLFSDVDDAAEGVVGAISSTMDDAANLMKTKFPFCIPWDVYLIVSFLAEEPQTPVFSLPIKLERLGIEEYIEIDLKDFEIVSAISRTFLTLLYCYALLNLTLKVFPIAKEGGD